jgi:RNA polymerase sigma-70 factor (ECF subfamily)
VPVESNHKEKELLRRIAENDESAFSDLFHAHHQRLAQHIFRLTESMPLAEEIVQDVFLKIWMTRETLMEIQNFGSYLFVIARNHANNSLRKVVNEKKHRREWEKTNSSAYQSDDSANFDQQWNTLIDRAIDQLPPQQKKVYMLSRKDRLKQEEIAKILHISKSTVKSHMQLATASIINHIRTNGDTTLFLLYFFFTKILERPTCIHPF